MILQVFIYFKFASTLSILKDSTRKYLNPEDINDNYHTASSRRILNVISHYDKIEHGVAWAKQIGLETIRAKCKGFDNWLSCLESLGNKSNNN